VAALALSACAATPTYYQPSATPQAMGYSEYRIEPGRYRVTFRGGSGAPAEQVADYALLRAADLAIADGYEWFRVVDKSMWRDGSDSGPHVSVGVGGGSSGYHSGVGVGVGTSFDLGPGPAVALSIEVLMGKGAKPDDRDVYNARDVRRDIGARAQS
jgi:hypothetical protein